MLDPNVVVEHCIIIVSDSFVQTLGEWIDVFTLLDSFGKHSRLPQKRLTDSVTCQPADFDSQYLRHVK